MAFYICRNPSTRNLILHQHIHSSLHGMDEGFRVQKEAEIQEEIRCKAVRTLRAKYKFHLELLKIDPMSHQQKLKYPGVIFSNALHIYNKSKKCQNSCSST
jgi:hypothetical protein